MTLISVYIFFVLSLGLFIDQKDINYHYFYLGLTSGEESDSTPDDDYSDYSYFLAFYSFILRFL